MPYLVDGNNVWGSLGGPAGVPDGRSHVLKRVAAFCRERGASAILVFDGAPARDGQQEQRFGAVTLRFPLAGQDADTLIRRIVDEAAAPGDFIVVTSDKSLYSWCRTRGARAMQSHEWKNLARESARGAGGREGSGGASDDDEKPSSEPDIEGWLAKFTGPR